MREENTHRKLNERKYEEVVFKQSTHQYLINGKSYRSWSSIIKLVHPDKDWDKIAENYAKKHKMDIKDVKALWANEGKESREKGTIVHSLKEYEDRERADCPVFFEDTIDDIKNIKPLETLEDGIHLEVPLYNNEYQACGTADKMFIETIDGVRYVDIDDYKTYKELKTESYFNPKTQSYDCFKAPLSHVMDCKLMECNLQLSTYAFFMEKYGFKPRRLRLIHVIVKELTPDVVNPKYVFDYNEKQFYIQDEIPYVLPYMKKEARALLEFHKSTLSMARI